MGDWWTYLSPAYNTIVGLVVGALATAIVDLRKQRKETNEQKIEHEKNLEMGVAILLRTQLIAYYSIYQDKEEISTSDWEDIDSIYSVYKKLGGNHTGDKIYSELSDKSIHKHRG